MQDEHGCVRSEMERGPIIRVWVDETRLGGGTKLSGRDWPGSRVWPWGAWGGRGLGWTEPEDKAWVMISVYSMISRARLPELITIANYANYF